jgi:hypothetical protein
MASRLMGLATIFLLSKIYFPHAEIPLDFKHTYKFPLISVMDASNLVCLKLSF